MMNPFVYALETPMKEQIGTFPERAGVAGSVTLLGMAAIFSVLTILWITIEVIHRLLNRGKKTDTPAPQPKPAASVAKPVPETPAKKPVPEQKQDDGALVAVITAAVAAAMEDEGYTGGFRVVSFRRTPTRRSGR